MITMQSFGKGFISSLISCRQSEFFKSSSQLWSICKVYNYALIDVILGDMYVPTFTCLAGELKVICKNFIEFQLFPIIVLSIVIYFQTF